MIISILPRSEKEDVRKSVETNSPTLSLTFLSARVDAVALLNRIILHFRPSANFKHSLWIWCANSRVGASMTARAPEPKSFFPFEFGESRAIIVGRRYEMVFPVPVGEIAARSRPYVVKSWCNGRNNHANSPREEWESHMTGYSSVSSTHISPSWKMCGMGVYIAFEVLQMFRNGRAHSNPSS